MKRYTAELAAFGACVIDGAPFPSQVSAEEGLRDVACIAALFESASKDGRGGWTKVPEC